MADASRDVEIDILARDKTAAGVRSAASNFDKLNDQVKRTGKKLTQEAGGQGTKAGAAFGSQMMAGLGRAAAAAGPVLAGMAIAAAPVIGATISAAVIGGAGIGGLVGGALIASRDARVQAAGKQLGETIMSQLEQSAVAFIDPLIDATHEVRASFLRAGNDIQGILRKSATFVKPLTQGATYAFERIISGVNKLVQGAGPVMLALRDGMANIGEAVEDVFDSLADNGVDAAIALNVAFGAIEGTIRTIGAVVNGLTEAFGFLARWGAFGKDVAIQYRAAETAAKHAKDSNEVAAGSFNRVADEAAGAAAQIKTYTQILEDARNNNLSLMEAQTRASIATRETMETIKENNKNIKNSAERADANKIALFGMAESFNRVRQATADANGVGVETVAITAQQRNAFIAAARAAGYSAQAAENLANELFGIPKSVDPKVKLAAEQAKRDAEEVRRRLNQIPRSIPVTIQTRLDYSGVRSLSAARRAIQSGGGPGGFDAVSHFRAAGSDRSRTGGPTPVSVESTVLVTLDGQPFREYTARAIDASDRRRRYRELVGRR